MFTADQILPHVGFRLHSYAPGDYTSTCPRCSHTRKKKHDKCVTIKIDTDLTCRWKCHHDTCGWSGPEADQLVGLDGPRPRSNASRKARADPDWHPIIPAPSDVEEPSPEEFPRTHLAPYCELDGRLRYYTRRNDPTGEKGKPITYGVLNGKRGWHHKRGPAPYSLYGLEWLPAFPDATVVLHEGEQKADMCNDLAREEGLRYVGLSWMGGAAGVGSADLEPLKGRNVIVWPDADAPGREAGAKIIERLKPIAKSVGVVNTEGLPERFDCANLDEPLGPFLEQRTRQEQRVAWFAVARMDDSAPAPQEWTVFDRFPKRQVSMLTGEGAAGKSTIALHLCAAHSLGMDWLGALLEPGGAFFIDAEDHIDVIHRRLYAVKEHYKTTFRAMDDGGLKIAALAGEDTHLAVLARKGKLEATAFYNNLLAEAGDLKPRTIVLSSSANFFGGVENDRAQVTQFLVMLTKMAIAADGSVVLIAHPSLTGINTGSGISGSTSWHNAVRARAYLTGVKGDNGDQPEGDLRQLLFMKNQYAPPSAKLILRWQNGMFLPEPTPSSFEKAAREEKGNSTWKMLLERFGAGGLSPNKTARNYAPRVFAQAPECIAAKLSERDMEAAMHALLQKGLIKIIEEGPVSKRRARIVLVEH